MSKPWRDKALRIIGELCSESYRQANQLPNGRYRKKHCPYVVPAEAQDLIECLRDNDEHRAKAIFIQRAHR